MNTASLKIRIALALAGALFLFAPMARAQNFPTYDVPWFTVDGGGGKSVGGNFSIEGTIGQPDAGGPAAGGLLDENSGFWHPYMVPCAVDFNGNGIVSIQDLFDFLAAYFAGSPTADFNASGALTPQDLFDFLLAWFTGCV